MKKIWNALSVEFLKTRKSKILLITIIVFTFVPLMMGLMVFVARNPEIAGKMGMVGTKAKMFGENDWPGFFAMLSQTIASIGLVGFGFVTSWVFGREHTDRTMKDILALPVARSSIVLAKFVVAFLWCILLALILFVVGISIGQLMHIPGWSAGLFSQFSSNYFSTALLTLLLCTPVAWLAGYSRSIIAPLGLVILTMIMAQFAGLIGLGPYLPWAIPGLFSVARDTPGFQLHFASYVILAFTFILGYWATLRWWRKADHH
ncbi:MAG: ABC transporter permease [Bacteroidetes bacterium]|nr:ABC transporter permease [Bacteroidota bacterium]MBU1719613.1 ABC transporter permease [Bacteroidota bacterium]